MHEVNLSIGYYYTFWYVNHAGIRKHYKCELVGIRFGTSEYYDTPRVLFDMRCIDRNVNRTFDPRKIEGPVESV